MRTLRSMLAETYHSWLRSISTCCGLDEKPRRNIEKPIVVLRDQPAVIQPPTAVPSSTWPSEGRPFYYDETAYEQRNYDERQERGRSSRQRSTSRGSFSARRRWLPSSSSSSRRPQISGPSNFRHLHSESFQFPAAAEEEPQPPQQTRQRPSSFRPLELSILMPENQLSPLHLPLLEQGDEGYVTPPPQAHIATPPNRYNTTWDDSSTATPPSLTHERSFSFMSFHRPRRPGQHQTSPGSEGSPFSNEPPPRIPARSRARAATTATTATTATIEPLVERIASAMIEKEILQAEIDSVIERQSLYISSRPSTAYGLQDLEPMPSIPALPAAAPSFAERLSTDRDSSRPRTAPGPTTSSSSSHHQSSQERTLALAAAAFNSHPPNITAYSNNTSKSSSPSYSRVRVEGDSPTGEFRDYYNDSYDRPLAPPLPLILRPPLRKKKSFSRVSNWLFPGGRDSTNGEHSRSMSTDSVTNLPKPIRGREGFYQCVAPPEGLPRTSVDTVSSVSSWETTEDNEEGDDEKESQTVPTNNTPTWSPSSSKMASPVIQNTPKHTPTIERTATFGRGHHLAEPRREEAHRPQSVGVAF
ncbi:hypothetical protein QBC46DRAFT_140562 [Diplogelasinospora grovesii]|uniref:Uncharacterized protein n=1 Tax=Diplogelasinospora grovesii TaxID=303347 RepID=A0AAN6N5Y0_9PEZI|nr:hypothetical protein QBC46DRAFT_140562 [Diplogelasinospora grovesii]